MFLNTLSKSERTHHIIFSAAIDLQEPHVKNYKAEH